MSKPNDVVNHKGQEWVSRKEFARRCNVTLRTITAYLTKGIIHSEDIFKDGNRYLNWATQQFLFEQQRNKNKVTTPKSKRKKTLIFTPKNVDNPNIGDLELKDNKEDIPEIVVDENSIDLANIDPYKYPQFWRMISPTEPERDPNGLPKLDYELLKTAVTYETYQTKLSALRGDLIPKTELLVSIQSITQILKANVDAIPQRYASQIIAVVETITNHEFTPEEHTRVINIMRSVPKELFASIQQDLEKLNGQE